MIRNGNCQDGILANCNSLTKIQTIKNMFSMLNSNIEIIKIIDGRLFNNLSTCAKLQRITI